MNDHPDDLSEAVVLFLAYGHASSPMAETSRLVDVFGAQKGAELAARVAALVAELGAIDVDWSTHSLQSAGAAACATIHARYPELSPRAVKALEWRFTFYWR